MTNPIDKIDNFYRYIMGKEVDRICQNYVSDEDTYVFAEEPRYSTLGYTNISKNWQYFCDSGLTLEKIVTHECRYWLYQITLLRLYPIPIDDLNHI